MDQTEFPKASEDIKSFPSSPQIIDVNLTPTPSDDGYENYDDTPVATKSNNLARENNVSPLGSSKKQSDTPKMEQNKVLLKRIILKYELPLYKVFTEVNVKSTVSINKVFLLFWGLKVCITFR